MNIFEIIVVSTPLVLVLLSLAFIPLISKKFWHKNEVLILTVLAISSLLLTFNSVPNAGKILKHSVVDDYIPFIIMLFTLYTLSNGIHIKLSTPSTTENNILFLGICSIFSSIIGTTGASMLFLKPFLEMNKDRENKTHLMIFFIFLVSNIGGLLTPLGDPPLLLGYLNGIEFLWCAKNLFSAWFLYVFACLLILYFIDKIQLKKENIPINNIKTSIKISGFLNIFLILCTVLILFSNFDYKIDLKIPYICKCVVPYLFLKNIILLIFCGISIYSRRKYNEKIDLEPFKEVARTFLVIFIVIAPVLFVLEDKSDAIHKYILNISNGSDGSSFYFWMCSLASSFLDNAPSYILFFNMAGADPKELMYIYPNILKAISISSVVMGAMTYIGNAPNMMVKAVSEKKGIKMPSFIGYIFWSSLIILPLSLFILSIIIKH